MRTICPNCKSQLTLDTLYDSKISYKCLNCDELLYLSDLIDINEAEKLLFQPPKIIRIKKDKIIVNMPVSKNIIGYAFFLIFALILFSIFLVPLMWGLFNINSNEFVANIINIFIGIIALIMGLLLLSPLLRKLFCGLFQKIKVIFTGNTIYICRGLGSKNNCIDINLIKRIYTTKSTKEYKDLDGSCIEFEKKICIEIENGQIIDISISDENEVNAKILLLLIKYFSYKKQGI